MSTLDKHYKEGRYSPIYCAECGFVSERLINQHLFESLWKYFYAYKEETLKKKVGIITDEIKEELLFFDFTVYKAIVEQVYAIKFEQALNQPSEPYRNFLKEMFSKSYLDEAKKIKITLNELFYSRENHLIDIICLQEVNERFIAQLKKDSIFKDNYVAFNYNDSYLLLNRKGFKNIKNPAEIEFELNSI